MNQKAKQSKITEGCDRCMAFGFYALIFFLPISSALIEWSFGIIFVSFIIKRVTILFDEVQKNSKQLSIGKKLLQIVKIFKPIDNILNKPLSAYIFVAFLSIFISHYPLLSIKAFVFKLLEGAYFYFMFIECMNNRSRLKIFLSVLFISILLTITNGFVQFITMEGFLRHHPMTDGRMTSSFRHSNDFGAYHQQHLSL